VPRNLDPHVNTHCLEISLLFPSNIGYVFVSCYFKSEKIRENMAMSLRNLIIQKFKFLIETTIKLPKKKNPSTYSNYSFSPSCSSCLRSVNKLESCASLPVFTVKSLIFSGFLIKIRFDQYLSPSHSAFGRASQPFTDVFLRFPMDFLSQHTQTDRRNRDPRTPGP
jgi:hypothetical protein